MNSWDQPTSWFSMDMYSLNSFILCFVMDMVGLGTARRLVKAGFGVYGMDYEGHGKSDGLGAYVPNFDHLVDDVSTHYTSICGNLDFYIG